jgi:hypothetical protein
VFLNGFLLASWSRTQTTVALSSCEAELGALSTGGQEGLFVQHLLGELGHEAELILYTDSSSALSTTYKRGVGRMRHLETRRLWLQDAVKKHRLTVEKIGTAENMADILTKGLPTKQHWLLAGQLGLTQVTASAPVNMLAGPAVQALDGLLTPVCGRCDMEMVLHVTREGALVWQCSRESCLQTMTWATYWRVQTTSSSSTRGRPTLVVPVVTMAGGPTASPAEASGQAAVGRPRQSPPTQRQLDYIATLMSHCGMNNVAEVLDSLETKTDASRLIDRLLCMRHVH